MSIELRFDFQQGGFSTKVELELASNGITAIFGPSGSGKTSLLRAIAGLDHHQGSFVSVSGTIWQDGNHFVPVHKRPLGVVFQQASLFSHLDVMENIEFGRKQAGLPMGNNETSSIIEMLDLRNLLHRRPANLSGGELQRVALARALTVEPELLLLDEPLASLDEKRKNEILPYLETLHRESKIPILYVTHSLNEVSRLADQMVVLEGGKVVASGTVAELFSRMDLVMGQDDQASTLVDAEVVKHDDQFGLSTLVCSGGDFTVAKFDAAIGSVARLRVFARDVSVTLSRQMDTSIQNIFDVKIVDFKPQGTAHVLVSLDFSGQTLFARLTQKSFSELDLKPGKKVFAQVKSVALVA
jgi:molybdate transport system ATP-binding protein